MHVVKVWYEHDLSFPNLFKSKMAMFRYLKSRNEFFLGSMEMTWQEYVRYGLIGWEWEEVCG